MAKKSPTTKREVPLFNPAREGEQPRHGVTGSLQGRQWIRGFVTAVAWSRRWGRFSDHDVVVPLRECGISLAAVRAAVVWDYDLQTISAALRALETAEDSIASLGREWTKKARRYAKDDAAATQDLARHWVIDYVTASGHVVIRAQSARKTKGSLSVLSTATYKAAWALRSKLCLYEKGTNSWVLNDPQKVSKKFRAVARGLHAAIDDAQHLKSEKRNGKLKKAGR